MSGECCIYAEGCLAAIQMLNGSGLSWEDKATTTKDNCHDEKIWSRERERAGMLPKSKNGLIW